MINSINNKMLIQAIKIQQRHSERKEIISAVLTIATITVLFGLVATWRG